MKAHARLEQRWERPGKTLSVMDMLSGWSALLWMLTGAVAIVGLVMGLQTALTGAALPPSWLRTMSLLLWLCLLPLPGLAFSRLQAQRAVWVSRVAPRPALISANKAWQLTLRIGLALSLLPLLLLGVMGLPPRGAAGFALFSSGLMLGTVGLGTLASAAWRGLVPSVWVLPGVCALAASPLVWATPAQAQAWQAAEGWRAAVLLVLAASPALAFAVLREALRLDGGVVARPVAEDANGHSLQARWQRVWHEWGGRLRALDGGSALGMLGGLWGQLPQQFINRNPEGLMFMPWGSSFTPLGGYRLLAFTLLALALLRSPSLHWRHHLAPGAALRSRLGGEVALYTGWMLVLLLGVLLGLAALLTVWWASDGAQLWQAAPSLIARYVPLLLLDLTLATALATVLRGWAGSLGKALLALLGLFALAGTLHIGLWLITGQTRPVLMQRDMGYVVIIALLIAALLAINRRVWLRVDLGALIRASRPKTPSPFD
jgi:hypothetical protein